MPTKSPGGRGDFAERARSLLAELSEAGKRHSAEDLRLIQSVHDQSSLLGADCPNDGVGDDPDAGDYSRSQPKGSTMEAARAKRLAAETKVLQEATLSHGDISQALRSALGAKYPRVGDRGPWVWVKDVYDDSVVCEVDQGGMDSGKLYRASYAVLDGKVTLGDPQEVYVQTSYVPVGESFREAAATKTVDGAGLAASAFAYVPDAKKPSTWKLRIDDAEHVGGAAAALGAGYRGEKVEIPEGDRAAVVAKVRVAWKKFHPDAKADAMPDGIKESAPESFEGDTIELLEKAVRRDDTVALKLISPGWGTSGYYSPEVLKRDGPTAFPAGTHQYWDHPTASEAAERPERSLRDLAAELVTPATWKDDGASGPVLYADAKVFGAYKEAVNDLAPHIGVSIRAEGTFKTGEAEGKKGRIIEAITGGKSVDFVTVPGRGGEILQLFEAARGGSQREPITPPAQTQKGSDVDLQEAQAALAEVQKGLAEAKAENARLAEAMLLRDAFEFARGELAKIDMPEISRARIAESMAREPIVKDGKLDTDAFKTKIRETAKVELQYLETATGRGMIRGMGTAKTANADEALERTAKAFRDLGLNEASALGAARGRAG